MSEAIIKAKKELYAELLKQDPDKLTKNEIELAWRLAHDPDIQTIFKEHNP